MKRLFYGIAGLFIFSLLLLSNTAFSLTLNDCIELAYKNSPSLLSAKHNVEVASAKMGQAASSVLPTISLSASKGKNYSQPIMITLPPIFGGGTISTAPDEPSDVTSYSFNVQQSLFTGGKILTAMSIAKSSYDMALLELKKASQEVEYNVIKSYYEYLKLKKSLEITESTIKNLERNLQLTQILFNSGIATETDLLRIKTAIANYSVAKINLKNAMDISFLALESTIGVSLPRDTQLNDILPEIETKNIPDQETVLETAFENRPDYLSFKQALNVAKSAVNLAYSNYLPNIAFTYSAGNTKSLYNKNATYNTDLGNWRAMFVASWVLFDGFKSENQVREAFASLNAAKAQENALISAVKLDVESSYLSLFSAVEKVNAGKIASDLAYRTMKSVEISYSADITSRQYYLESQNAYNSSYTDYWNSRYDFEIAKAKLNKSVGKKII